MMELLWFLARLVCVVVAGYVVVPGIIFWLTEIAPGDKQ
jgi:hypothetical protein